MTGAPGGPYGPYVDQDKRSLYNADDNLVAFLRSDESAPADDRKARDRMRVMIGDVNNNGRIDSSDTPENAIEKPYLLWSAGADGLFGPPGLDVPTSPTPDQVRDIRKAAEKCDDVMNVQ
jgi:hypothetical protein